MNQAIPNLFMMSAIAIVTTDPCYNFPLSPTRGNVMVLNAHSHNSSIYYSCDEVLSKT